MIELLLLAPLLISSCSGTLRALTGIEIGFAYLISLSFYPIASYITTRIALIKLSSSPAAIRALLIAALCTLLSLAPQSYGFVNFGTADGGNHIRNFDSFVTSDPSAYNGFVGLYSLLFLIQKLLHLPTEIALIISLGYLRLIVLWILTVWARQAGAKIWSVIALLLLIELPLLIYLQGNGFYPQVYGLAVLLLALRYASNMTTPLQLGVITVGSAALVRFSYGLNLSDLLLSGGIAMLLRQSYITGFTFVGLAAAAILKLSTILHLRGAFAPPLTIAIVFALIFFLLAANKRRSLPILFIVASGASWIACGLVEGFRQYYVAKYLVALCAVLGIACSEIFSSAKGAKKAMALCSLVALFAAVSPYTLLSLKVFRHSAVSPEVDVRVTGEIRSYLESKQETFRIFIGTRWARTNMINALFDCDVTYQDFADGHIPPGPGCIFFELPDSPPKPGKKDRRPGMTNLLHSLKDIPHNEIKTPAPWKPGGELVLHVVCNAP